jgi:hypothetical protein
MVDLGCSETMTILNHVFATALIMNDGHEILARLNAGDDPADIVLELGRKFGQFRTAGPDRVESVISAWPALHKEAASVVLQWALSKLDTEERISIAWKGDDTSPDTLTRFELRGNRLTIEVAHPPS